MDIPYLRTSLAVVGAGLWLAPTAFGATAAVDGTTLRYDAAPGEGNVAAVSQVAPGEYRIFDETTITPGAGCTADEGDPSSVRCTSSGFQLVVVNLGDRDDSIFFDLVVAPTIVDGGEGDDALGGAGAGDLLNGGPGDDTFSGSAADDRYEGGPGSDFYAAPDDGADIFAAGAGTDTASYGVVFDGEEPTFGPPDPLTLTLDDQQNDGRAGERDNLFDVEDAIGGNGNDVITGNAESNTLLGGGGNDRVDGATGNDTVSGSSGNDGVFGGEGADDTIGDTGDDGLDGGPGDDNLFGGPGEDGLNGAAGDDNLDGGSGPDVLGGGDGVDTADYSVRFGGDPDEEGFTGNRVVVTLDGANDDGFPGESDNALPDVENASTGNGADIVAGNAAINGILTGAGNDIVNTRDQVPDAVICGAGFDTVRADGLDQVDVEGEDRCERVEVIGAAPPPPGPPAPPTTPTKVKPRSLIVKVGPGRDRRAPYKFRTSGRVSLPNGISPATSCNGGRVRVTIKRGTKTISSRTTSLRSNCTYSSSVRFSRSRRQARGQLKVTVRFLGNAVLEPTGRKTRTVRAG